jgi:hypothetical protein
MVDGDQVGIDETNLAIASLNAGKDEAIDQDREALATGDGGHDLGSLPRLGENLCFFGMRSAIDVADVVGQSGRSRK